MGKSVGLPSRPSRPSRDHRPSSRCRRSSSRDSSSHRREPRRKSRSSSHRERGSYFSEQGSSSDRASGSGSRPETRIESPIFSGADSSDDLSDSSDFTEVAGPTQLSEAFIAGIIRLGSRLHDLEQIVELAVDFEKECGGRHDHSLR